MLRIVGGEARGRRVRVPEDGRVRPTSDRVKEALFDILGQRVAGSRVLDLFAGSGNLGLEALSRGAAAATFVDRDPRCRQVIGRNLADLGYRERARVLAGDALAVLRRLAARGERFDLVFLDPPYAAGLLVPALEAVAEGGLLAEDGLAAAEHAARDEPPARVGRLVRRARRQYGDTSLSFYAPEPPGGERPAAAGREAVDAGE